MGRTFKDGDHRNREKRIHRIRKDGYLFPDSDMAEIDNRDDWFFAGFENPIKMHNDAFDNNPVY